MHTEQNASCFQDLWNLLMEQIKKSNEMRYELTFLLIWFRCLLFHTNKIIFKVLQGMLRLSNDLKKVHF
jgi:hypothetical protein